MGSGRYDVARSRAYCDEHIFTRCLHNDTRTSLEGCLMQQKTITIETQDGVNLGGVSLGTGYPWFVELLITLVVMAVIYGMKKYIDVWFDKRRQIKITERFSEKIKKQKHKNSIEKDIWKDSK